MRVTELQMGDYVNYRGQIIKVTSLYDKGGSNEVGWGEREDVWVNASNVEPIPLAPEILEKNGFRIIFDGELHMTYVQDIEGFHIEVIVDKIGIYQKISMFDGLGNGVTIVVCKYIHQFQNAMRMCGIKKEIEL